MRTASINKKRVFCIAIAICVANVALGQLQEEWVVRYDGPGAGQDIARVVTTDSAGNVYVAGSTYLAYDEHNYLTQKYDTNGNLLWQRQFSGVLYGPEVPMYIAVDGADNVYVTGSTLGPLFPSRAFLTIKYDSNGNLLWSRIDAPAYLGTTPTGFVLADDGSMIVTGHTTEELGDKWMVTIKYDTDGTRLWLRRYRDGSQTNSAAATADSQGNVYVTGVTGFDYLIVKYSSSGTQLWVRRYDTYGWPSSMTVDNSGDLYVAGWGGGRNYLTIKYDSDGNLLWERSFDGGVGVDEATAIATDSDGFVFVTGFVTTSGAGRDYATLKYDSLGTLLWSKSYDGPASGDDTARRMAVDGAGNVYVTGDSEGIGTGIDYATLAYDADGNLVSEMRYNGPGNRTDISRAIAVDSQGNVFVTGDSNGSGTGEDFVTIKYSQVSDVVLPDSFSLFRGILTGGGLSDLLASDDSWLRVRPGITLNQAERQVQLIVVGTAPTETPSELRIRVEAHAEINNIGQWIELWNYDTSSWEEVDFMIATLADSIVEVSITVDPGRFIEAGTKQMKAKISYKEAGIVLFFPWLISFDQTVWVIIP